MSTKQPFEDVEALKKMKGLAVAWLREEDWPRWLALDPAFQSSYAHWHQRIEAAFTRYQDAGINVVKVTLTPNEFLEWAKANGGGVGTNERAHFAAMKAMAMDLH